MIKAVFEINGFRKYMDIPDNAPDLWRMPMPEPMVREEAFSKGTAPNADEYVPRCWIFSRTKMVMLFDERYEFYQFVGIS
jgi:hypothetical protein